MFSQIASQWTKERNRFKVSTIRSILLISYNFKNIERNEFFKEIRNNRDFLREVQKSEKYDSDSENEN